MQKLFADIVQDWILLLNRNLLEELTTKRLPSTPHSNIAIHFTLLQAQACNWIQYLKNFNYKHWKIVKSLAYL